MREKGKVVEVIGFIAKVRIEPGAACETCPAYEYCRSASKNMIIEATNTINALPGDDVYIQTSTRQSMIAMFFLFVIPVLFGLTGVAATVHKGAVYMVISGWTGFVFGLLGAKIIDLFSKKRGYFLPEVVKVLKPEKS